jgi:hypothetical protein
LELTYLVHAVASEPVVAEHAPLRLCLRLVRMPQKGRQWWHLAGRRHTDALYAFVRDD